MCECNATNDQRTKFCVLHLVSVGLLLRVFGLAAPREADSLRCSNRLYTLFRDSNGTRSALFPLLAEHVEMSVRAGRVACHPADLARPLYVLNQ